jgi:hypothetical protein
MISSRSMADGRRYEKSLRRKMLFALDGTSVQAASNRREKSYSEILRDTLSSSSAKV